MILQNIGYHQAAAAASDASLLKELAELYIQLPEVCMYDHKNYNKPK